MKPTLLVLAAGMGSRYGGIKQVDGFGPNGETILDYSVYDAIKAGFGKIVFVVRQEIQPVINNLFENKLKDKAQLQYAYQELNAHVPHDIDISDRTKPWGTGHAILVARELIHEPFAVINADDFYGYDAFKTMCHFLQNNNNENEHAMVGYYLKNTLSDNGSVSRGQCVVNQEQELVSVTERTQIERKNNTIVYSQGETEVELSSDTVVSMNFWGFKANQFELISNMFNQFIINNAHNPKSEFYIPTVVTKLIQDNLGKVKVLKADSQWFGVTYPDDKAHVQQSLQQLVEDGTYPSELWKN